jgi:hypothetical protein
VLLPDKTISSSFLPRFRAGIKAIPALMFITLLFLALPAAPARADTVTVLDKFTIQLPDSAGVIGSKDFAYYDVSSETDWATVAYYEDGQTIVSVIIEADFHTAAATQADVDKFYRQFKSNNPERNITKIKIGNLNALSYPVIINGLTCTKIVVFNGSRSFTVLFKPLDNDYTAALPFISETAKSIKFTRNYSSVPTSAPRTAPRTSTPPPAAQPAEPAPAAEPDDDLIEQMIKDILS